MRKYLLISSLLAIIFSCEKETDFCSSKECQDYFSIWKTLFISRNQISESYFDDHIYPFRTQIDRTNDGQFFRVDYKIKIDWAESNLSDQFAIWLDPSTAGLYPSIPAPRSKFLTKDQIGEMVNIFAFNSTIQKVSAVEHLKYGSRKDALNELRVASGISDLGDGEVFYISPGFFEDPGHPLLRVKATINQSENRCMQGILNLVTGECEIRETACIVYLF